MVNWENSLHWSILVKIWLLNILFLKNRDSLSKRCCLYSWSDEQAWSIVIILIMRRFSWYFFLSNWIAQYFFGIWWRSSPSGRNNSSPRLFKDFFPDALFAFYYVLPLFLATPSFRPSIKPTKISPSRSTTISPYLNPTIAASYSPLQASISL